MSIHHAEHRWILETRHAAYAFDRDPAGRLIHRYWGSKLRAAEDYDTPDPRAWPFSDTSTAAQEFPGHGGIQYGEPCLKVGFADGTRDIVLRFESACHPGDDPDALDVSLRDEHYPLAVVLHYRVHEAYDLIERSVSLRNEGSTPLTVERVLSAAWQLPYGDHYRLTHLAGRWSDEGHLLREPLLRGVKRLESRRMATSHQHGPWFALDLGHAGEQHGNVWFGTLAWSGNWVMLAEVTDSSAAGVSIGLNDWDFAWRLEGGQTLTTPSSFGGYSDAGFGTASRLLHDFIRATILPHGGRSHNVLYNSWEATTFNVDEQSQAELAQIAAGLGVETFVMDDGWFQGRATDKAGLGDWWPDAGKFPRGLTPLIERVNTLGMDFGLWIEPEMVNRDSDLYRAHPNWVIHFPTRHRSEARNQLVLNLARSDVQTYLIDALDRLLSSHNIAFIKWDMNRSVSEPGWPEAPGDAREIWVRYVRGLYAVWGALRDRHPDVVFQSCSGGGGRADLGILRLADQIWTSDNTEATARLGIQEGFSMLFPAAVMESWATDVGAAAIPLSFRFHVAMCGVLGVGCDIARWTAAERAEAARWIALYKEIRPLVQRGDQFRLRSPQEHQFSAVQYMSKDRAAGVLFAFRTWLPFPAILPVLHLQGLDPEARYAVEDVQGVRSGAGWMHGGIRLDLENMQSTVRRIRRL